MHTNSFLKKAVLKTNLFEVAAVVVKVPSNGSQLVPYRRARHGDWAPDLGVSVHRVDDESWRKTIRQEKGLMYLFYGLITNPSKNIKYFKVEN